MGKFKDFPGDFITIRVLEKEIELKQRDYYNFSKQDLFTELK